jgi:hypothetical protein
MMSRFIVAIAAVVGVPVCGLAGEISGKYLEARTCQVYTGPCFANSEVGLTGNDAVMSWCIEEGQHGGVDLKGLKVAVIVRASNTLGFSGLDDARSIKAMVIVDESASCEQQKALVEFAKSHAGKAGQNVEEVRSSPIQMSLDTTRLVGTLQAGKLVSLQTRQARPSDCICSNETGYYPPLTQLTGSVPGVTIDGRVSATSLGTSWSIPDSRTAYLGTFSYQ